MNVQPISRISTRRPAFRQLTSLLLALALALLIPAGLVQAAENSITSPDTDGNVGAGTALVLDASGYPIIAYYDDTNGNLKLVHCNDPNCSGGDENMTSPDTITPPSDALSLLFRIIDMKLDSNGHPVILYNNNINGSSAELKLMHCNDINCAGADESIVNLDSFGIFNVFASLALDSNGYPVVSYWDLANQDLKLAHCNDVNCAGNDESITTLVDSTAVGGFTSLALDSSDYPLIVYEDSISEVLTLAHCNDANCAGGDESIAVVDTSSGAGTFNSLALDSSGYPVISYSDQPNDSLKLAHCNDANCAGGDESVTTVDSSIGTSIFNSLALDNDGYPVISYFDETNNDLKLAHCNDANCTGGDESIVAVDTSDRVGTFNSLALDNNGFPVVSYWDNNNEDLKLLHCGSATCTNSAPTASDDGYSTDEGVQLNVAAPGVLENDSDVDHDPLTAALVTDASHGALTLNPDGSFTYVPDAGFTGDDTFTYVANDGSDDSNTATVTITVELVCPTFPVMVTDEAELNQAIACYNALTTPGSYTIILGADINLSASSTTIDNVASGVELLIDGAGYTVDAQNGSGRRSFTIAANTVVTMNSIMLTGGNHQGGGAVYNRGTLTVTDSILSGNSAANYGGGIFNNSGTLTVTDSTFTGNSVGTYGGGAISTISGTLTVTGSTFSGNSGTYGSGISITNGATVTVTDSIFSSNSATYSGGAIYSIGNTSTEVTNSTFSGNSANAGASFYNADGATLTVTGSTFSDNSGDYGGGILNVDNATLSVTDSTFSGNSATNNGGGILNDANGMIEVTNSTFSGNSAGAGGGLFNNGGTLTIYNTIVANSPSGGNCSGSITDGGGNLVWGDTTCPGLNADPKLLPLADNGGATQTMALGSGSAAIDAAVDANCPTFDQRGVARPQGAHCDIGAYEAEITNTAPTANPGGPYLGAINTAIQFDGSASSDPEGDSLTYAWDFGDGNSGTGAMPTHSYTDAGIYDVCLTVNDGTVDSDPVCTIAVVYDPSGGFVTGGGWIDSPAGAYMADPSLSGKATFGFVSKYKKGASVPTGNTEFQFNLAVT